MIDAASVADSRMSLSVKMIRDEVLNRGWQAWTYYPGSAHLRLKRPDGKTLEIFAATPPTTTFVAGDAANNKYVSSLLHEDSDLPVPKTWLIENDEAAQKIANELISRSVLFVVKPLDSAHGNGITVGVDSKGKLAAALKLAREYSESILIQEQIIDPVDIRLTCVNYKFLAALMRLPARVRGDGSKTIEALIDAENSSNPLRGPKYTTALNYIDVEGAKRYLGEKMQDVPQDGQMMQVVGTANHGTGGELVDITDNVPAWLVEYAERAAKASSLPVCGVDFLVKKNPSRQSSHQELDPKIIEVNKCPAIFMHEPPAIEKSRGVVKAYIDYLENL